MQKTALLPLSLGLLAFAACTDREPERIPDRVVGITIACDFVDVDDGRLYSLSMEGWDLCPRYREYAGFANHRQVLTIRAGDGGTYTVDYGPEHTVRIGDEWPP